ncbi:MAG: hypothetical protein IKM18_07665 [Clostridia bacterium]|nr:hypothetical protein [Clostridia bacterium]MBR3715767.1 hypothetical protein [Clostridia bacterium]
MDNKVIIQLSSKACKNEAVSRFFGSPTIPGEWFDDEIFGDGEVFVCQIALADFTDFGGYSLLPTDGYIYFFFDTEDAEDPLRIRFFGDTPDTVVEDFNDSVDFDISSSEYSVIFSKDGASLPGASISSVEPCGDDVILFDFTNADKELFNFLGDKKKIKISKSALKSLEFDKAELI